MAILHPQNRKKGVYGGGIGRLGSLGFPIHAALHHCTKGIIASTELIAAYQAVGN